MTQKHHICHVRSQQWLPLKFVISSGSSKTWFISISGKFNQLRFKSNIIIKFLPEWVDIAVADHLKYTRKFRNKVKKNKLVYEKQSYSCLYRNRFNAFTIFNFNAFVIFNINFFNTFNTFTLLISWKYYKIPSQEIFKKSFRNLVSSYLHVQYFEEIENNYQNWHCLSGSDIFIKFIEWPTFYDWKKDKKASLLLPALLLPLRKTKKNVASAQFYSRQNQHNA